MSHQGKRLVQGGLVFAAVWAASFPDVAQAVTRIWDGSSSSSFTLGSNWTTGVAPSSTDIASFSGAFTNPPTISADDTVAGIVISVNVTITVNAGVDLTVNGDFTQSNGTYNQGSGFIDISGSLNLSGGTFRASSTRTEIGGAFNKDGGTFNANTGRLILNSTSSQTLDTDGATFYDLHINDGLRAYWKLDETSSPARDSSGYGNDLTWQISPSGDTADVAPTLFQSGASFEMVMADRDAATATMPTNLELTLPITLSAWYKATAKDTNASDIISGRDAYVLRLDAAGPALAKHYGGDLWQELKPTQSGYMDGNWHHLVGVLSSSGMFLYYDGNLISSNATYTNAISYANTGGTTLAIGRHGAGNTGMDFGGNIDDVRIYSRALSAAEVNSLYIGHQPAGGVATHTLDTGNAPIIANDLVIDSGTLAAGTNGISVAGNWWNYGGVFTGTGTVTFTGTTAASTSNVIRSAGQPFGAITVNQASRTWTLADRLWAPGGALTITAGTLAASSYGIHAGSLTEAGTFTPGTGTVVLDSSTDQTFEAASFSALKIEDPTETNLVGYWKLDEGQGTRVRDYSGNGNTGTLVNGPKWTTGVSSTIGFDDPAAVTFSGNSTVDDHATITASGALAFNPNTSRVTVAYWMYYAATPTVSQDAVVLDHVGLLQTGFVRNVGVTYLAAWNSGGGASPLASTSSIPAAGWHHFAYSWDGTNSKLYIDGGTPVSTTTNAPTSSIVSTVWLGSYDGANELFAGRLDDVRIYNAALTQAQIGSLAAGRYAGTGGVSTLTLSGPATVNGTFAIDSGGVNTSTFNLTAANTDATKVAYVNSGTLTVGSGIAAFPGGLTVQRGGTLALATSGGSTRIATGKTLIVDGTLNASSTGATIRNNGSGNYAFSVGSTATATPTLNVSGLAVQNTDTNGMRINVNTSAVTTFTNFNNIAFSSGTAGGNLLQIYASSLSLISNGCTFDASTTNTVRATGDGFTTEATQTRILLGNATCSAGSCQSTKSDDDSNNDGVPTAASGGAVVTFLSNAPTDTAGTIEGFPSPAFSWNDGSWYATYVAFHDTSGTVDTVYVRDATGDPRYSWSTPSSETIVGTPRWTTEGTGVSEKHYLYVALSSGKVYRLLDNGSSLAPDTTSTGWSAANPYDCACAITTPIAMDYSNLYWAGQRTSDSSYRIWAVGQANQSLPGWSPMRPSAVSSPTTGETVVTSAAPSLWVSGSTYAFIGQTGYLVKADVSTGTVAEYNSNPGSGRSILGRIMVIGTGTNRVLAGDDGGQFWSIAPGTFTGTNQQWGYTALAGSDQFRSSPFYDHANGYVGFGSDGGRLIVLNAATGSPLAGYPMTSLTTDPMRMAILYRSGVVAVGTTTGKLFFVNRRTTSGGTPVLMKEYYFGSTQQVSGIAYDSASNKYMVSTSGSSSGGRLYMIDASDSILTDTDGNL